jgi:hypothetical protein
VRKSATKAVVKTKRKSVPVITQKKPQSVDDQLSEHLKLAEDHLIAAVKLFYGPGKPQRVQGYLQRLERAQIAITGLYREELVRIRGPIRRRGSK